MPRTDWGFHPGSQSLYRRHLFSSHSLKKQETIMAGDTLIMTLDGGDVVIKLRPDLAPKHVEQITALANEGVSDVAVFRSEERRVGKDGDGKCRYRWSP